MNVGRELFESYFHAGWSPKKPLHDCPRTVVHHWRFWNNLHGVHLRSQLTLTSCWALQGKIDVCGNLLFKETSVFCDLIEETLISSCSLEYLKPIALNEQWNSFCACKRRLLFEEWERFTVGWSKFKTQFQFLYIYPFLDDKTCSMPLYHFRDTGGTSAIMFVQ